MHISVPFPKPEPIEVQGEEVWVMKEIVDNRMKNGSYQFLVHQKGHIEQKVNGVPLTHLAGF
jgi:hypothetical protein